MVATKKALRRSRSRRNPLLTGRANPSTLSLQPSAYGFTLLEILVTMALMALVTVIAVTAFKLTVHAWGRISDEGESRQIQSALSALLENQLEARVKMQMFGQAKVDPALYFCGDENAVSFMTAYAPRGSLLQGMSRVSYEFDPVQKTLLIYQQVVTRLEDLDDIGSRYGRRNSAAGDPVSRIPGISNFSLAYTGELMFNPDDARQWQNVWACGADSTGFPAGLMLKMTIGEGVRSRTFTWVYRLGGQTIQSVTGGQRSLGPSSGQRSVDPFRGR